MIKKLINDDFNKNALKLISGTALAQAVPIAISPILTRIYTPDDLGVLALFISIVAIFGAIANGRYELAIVLPVKDEDAVNLVALSILISFLLSISLLFIIIIFNQQIYMLFKNKEIIKWFYFIPLSVFFIGLFNALNYLNTRFKTFGLISKVKIIKSVTLSFFQISLGLLKNGAGGLIIGQVISYVFSNWNLAKGLFYNKKLLSSIKKESLVTLAKRYSRFPKFTLWATLSNSLTLHLINIFIPFLYSTTVLGFYSVVQRALGMPSTLISQSIGQVFFERASEEKKKFGHAKKVYKKTIIKLSIISFIVFGLLFVIIQELFIFVFGPEWEVAGVYARYLIPLFFIRFIASPLTLINIVFEKQKIDLIWQLCLLSTSLIIFILTWLLKLDITIFLISYTSSLIINYIIIIFITYFVAKNKIA